MNLSQVKIGNTCKIVSLNGEGALKRRIMDMGLTKKTLVKVVKYAPLGDPIELELRGYSLSIRMSEAEKIEVESVK